jgi:hypothetical protein
MQMTNQTSFPEFAGRLFMLLPTPYRKAVEIVLPMVCQAAQSRKVRGH